MKTYKTVLRAVLMLTTIFLLALGALFSYQNWAGSKNLLWAGLLFFIVMIGDHYIGKRIRHRRESQTPKND
jgi:membrane protein implicated in regulation of membrane protease activity